MKSRKVVLSFETVDEILRCGHIKCIKKLKCLCPILTLVTSRGERVNFIFLGITDQ